MTDFSSRQITKDSLVKLEFPAVLDLLAAHCQFAPAVSMALDLRPSSERTEVERLLAETAEAVEVVARYPDVSVGGASDLREMLDHAVKGSRLPPEDLLSASQTLHVCSELSRAIRRASSGDVMLPNFLRLASGLVELPFLEQQINQSIGSNGEVLDSASDDLARARREIRTSHGRLMDRLNRMISGDRYATVLQDNLITTRDGRYVLPVRAEARAKMPGVVHDVSASGRTLFMEPMEIVELNNRWREAITAEQHEIDRILLHLSNALGAESEPIQKALETLADIDLILAKAKLSFATKSRRPKLWPERIVKSRSPDPTRLRYVRARHPLMDIREVVPINVEVGISFRALLVTGPNTGGKTVALKTVGLLAAMAQAGLFITADDESFTSVFEGIFVDVGDEQSIAQSLSTFSGHMTNVIRILEMADEKSLVLIDEIGSGTDPQEGSALARAVVSAFMERGPLLIATTHYSEVKTFAYETPGVENASVEFDLETLAPTYRLLVGIPGQSNALAIAKRLGLSEEVLERANAYLNRDDIKADRMLQDIQDKRRTAEREAEQIASDRLEISRLRAETEEAWQEAEYRRKTAYDEALLEAEMLMSEARRIARESDRQLRNRQHVPADSSRSDHLSDQAAESVAAVQKLAKSRGVERRVDPIQVGDRVKIRSLDQEGQVVHVGLEDAQLQMGSLRLTRPLLDLVKQQPLPQQKSTRPKYQQKSVHVPVEIDIRGTRYEEARDLLDGYLNEAALSSLPYVRIIHGKGTGALRKAVTEYLRSSPVVEKFQHGKPEEGGDGVTVVYLNS